jgi:hypothetical protein
MNIYLTADFLDREPREKADRKEEKVPVESGNHISVS